MGSHAFIPVGERPLALDVQTLANRCMRMNILEPRRVLKCVVSRSSLFEHIYARRYDDPHFLFLKNTVQHGDAKEVTIGDDAVLRLQGRICVPNVDGLRVLVLEEAHSSRLLDTDLVCDALEKLKFIQEHLRTTQSRQRSYADRKACDVAYMVGEKVLLRVLPMKEGKADALSRKVESMGSLAFLLAVERPLAIDAQALAN
ncbi:uncharacterized protein [Nicotiana tomentosiformis]|uniref:uncharacterized protein n=1 Tax=Nicotiana tomentosiformis TaxID=4098 RepID=UPI00388CA9AA